ncbi:MAG: FAD-dependent oxidoreductase [Anaerolineales bacterium]|nr:MAG: FAD-dependent oxidoreductase [Anaerolineales bacterium]
MTKPVILTVDDEPQVLNAVERDLRQHYRGEYRILKANSGGEALEAVHQLKRRNAPVALFLADQRMPTMSGTEFLAEARQLYPEARKVLLTAYADTEAAIQSINTIGLDFYLMKPWDPPEQNLYPVLDDLLSDWLANAPLPYDGIRVAGTLWSPSCHRVKDFLARNRIAYQWLDIEKDAEAKALVEGLNREGHQLPVVFFPDGEVLIEPDNLALAEKCGLQTQATQPFYDVIIVGAGPAGLGAAVYGASEGLRTLMIDREATGGQAGTSSRIENYLGFPKGLSGTDLAQRATVQAKRLGAEILTAQEVTQVRVQDPYRFVTLSDGTELGCRALVIATGVSVRKLDVPGVEALSGAGVYYGAALTEAANYRDQHVFVVGGANSAGQGAMFFSRYASKVTILVRGSALEKGMSQYLVDQIYGTPNIEVLTHTQVIEALGKERLEAITIENNETGQTQTLPAAAMFLFIGAAPHSDLVAGVVECNSAGFIITGPDLSENGRRPKRWKLKRDPYMLETSVPGIFAAGDIRQGAVRRVASAVGQGAIAISLVHQYLKTV